MRFGGLIAAIVVAALAAIIVLRMSDNSATPAGTASQSAAATKTIHVYVAARTIPVGSAITADMVAAQPWPEHLALPSFVKVGADNANVVGMVARAPFQQNEPIIASKLANPNDPNFLAGDLPAGMRIITIPVNEVDGLAGFIFPGDHVDMVYTHDVETWETGAQAYDRSVVPHKTTKTVTETLLTNVKVVAVDQRSSNTGSTDKAGNLVIPRSASLMVSQADAQRVRLAQKTGSLSLALRALADREVSDPLILTEGKDVSQKPAGTAQDTVLILRGAPKIVKQTEAAGTIVNRSAPLVTSIVPVGNAAPAINPAPVAP